jgi:hypothetical protein
MWSCSSTSCSCSRSPSCRTPDGPSDKFAGVLSRPAADGRLVGLDLYGLGHQLAGPRAAAGADHAVRGDGRGHGHDHADPQRVRRARPGLRRGLCGFIQVGRSAVHPGRCGRDPFHRRTSSGFQAWLATSGVFWIAGGLAEGEARLALWAVAIGLEYVSPAMGFWTPGLGRSNAEDWDRRGRHLAERCALFTIIALGESIIVTGATVVGLPGRRGDRRLRWPRFAGSIAMWWIYFSSPPRRPARRSPSRPGPRPGGAGRLYLQPPVADRRDHRGGGG